MEEARHRGFSGRVYRHAHPAHGDPHTTLRGSRRVGGRFNPKDEFGAVYFSLDRATAEQELLRLAERMAVRVSELAPRTVFTYDVSLDRILDLTDDAVRAAWLGDPSELAGEDWTRCQEVGRLAREQGFEAVLYPSVTGAGSNLAVFLDRIRPDSIVALREAEPLDLGAIPSGRASYH